jgi:hypothetical protein
MYRAEIESFFLRFFGTPVQPLKTYFKARNMPKYAMQLASDIRASFKTMPPTEIKPTRNSLSNVNRESFLLSMSIELLWRSL